jgi:hypothetical protein
MFRLANSTNGDDTCKSFHSTTRVLLLDVCLPRISHTYTTRLGKRGLLIPTLSNTLIGNGFNVWICAQLESQLAIICASLPSLRSYLIPDPSVPIVFYTNSKHDSVISRVSSSLSGQIKRLPLVRTTTPRILEISRPIPQTVEIPAWEFEAFESPRSTGSLRYPNSPIYANSPAPVSPLDETSYEQYVRGQFGPPAPPKDSRLFFDQYRREHGEIV